MLVPVLVGLVVVAIVGITIAILGKPTLKPVVVELPPIYQELLEACKGNKAEADKIYNEAMAAGEQVGRYRLLQRLHPVDPIHQHDDHSHSLERHTEYTGKLR